tara:strand:- start:175 stop:381 length:207 start_codon:yes stop_codon:yes gene_type:complete
MDLYNVKDYLTNLFFHLILNFNLGIQDEYRNIFANVLFNATNRSFFLFLTSIRLKEIYFNKSVVGEEH